MKKWFALIVCFSFLFCLCSCNNHISDEDIETLNFAGQEDLVEIDDGIFDDNDEFFIGSWLSYIELIPAGFDGNEESYRDYINSLAEKMKKYAVTDLFLQIRPFCDAVYPSEYAVSSSCVTGVQGGELPFDFLSVIIEVMKEKNIGVHGWINPLRVQNTSDLSKLSDDNIAKKWYDENSINVKEAAGGLYLNPASKDVHILLCDVVKELLTSYDLKGIHIDDYFYPTDEESFDKEEYEKYSLNGGNLDLQSYRREIISTLVKNLYSTVKSFGEDKIFSISPSADIEKNQNVLFADVKRWSSEDGFCDMIIPQIYFGFENETKPFWEIASLWKKTVTNKSKLCCGLALYKIGKEDAFAGKGKDEWKENKNIIERQIETAKKLGYSGVCFYSVTYMN